MKAEIRKLKPDDVMGYRAMLALFGDAFEDVERYTAAQPTPEYIKKLLLKEDFIALVAILNGKIIGAIAAYELQKFERETSEVYIYDLAVDLSHRRKGVAMAMTKELKSIAAARHAEIIFVQADQEDTPAIELYDKLGRRAEVLHFDIKPEL